MPALISDGQVISIRRSLGMLLVHTYARRTVSVGAEDSHGDAAATFGSATTGIVCHYRAQSRVRMDNGGATLVYRPTIKVAADDPLDAGDEVSQIMNRQGVMVAAGPFIVGRRLDSDDLGVTLQRSFELLGADTLVVA